MADSIVLVNVAQQQAPIPPTLQRTGCFVSQGGTVLSPHNSGFLSQLSDLAGLLTAPLSITGLTWLSSVATITVASHPWTVGQKVWVDVSGATPAGYNGKFLATITSSTQLTYDLLTNPGAATVLGYVAPHSLVELSQMATTFFAQGYQQGIYILELGPGDVATGVASLTTYLNDHPNSNYQPGAVGYFYGYLVPRAWDGDSNFLALIASYENTTARTYFWVTTTLENYPLYSTLMKSVFALVEAPQLRVSKQLAISGAAYASNKVTLTVANSPIVEGDWFQVSGCTPATYNGWHQAAAGSGPSALVYKASADPGTLTVNGVIVQRFFASTAAPNTEFTLASVFWVTLHYDPSDTNKVPPLAFSFVYGVTPFPVMGMGPVRTALRNVYVNVISTGAEGGITNAMVIWGRLLDGKAFNYWYTADWVAINADIELSNAIINGSNTPLNPLYYNQNGIDRLEAVLAKIINRGVTFGLILFPATQVGLTGPELSDALSNNVYVGKSVVNAVPFIPYSFDNPTHYGQGIYMGLSASFVPVRGFEQLTVNFVVSSFVVQ